jgi:uncharacterized protein
MTLDKYILPLFLAFAASFFSLSASADLNPLKALGDVFGRAKASESEKLHDVVPSPVRPTYAGNRTGTSGNSLAQRSVVYEGYTKEMLPIKELIASGKLQDAINKMKERYPDPVKYDILTNLELGTMLLDATDAPEAQKRFADAERGKVEQKDTGVISGLFSSVAQRTVTLASGNDELSDYDGPGFERVLMLNYKSISYMLEGERKAYNVTRRAIDLQNIEKKEFDAKVRKAEEEIKEKERESQKKGVELNDTDLDRVLNEQYSRTDKLANKLPSAFVNPFGFYIAGIVQEFDSYVDKSLRGNARISYQKALELNPDSAVIKQAVKESSKPVVKDRRLVHVVVGDGFAPEKKLLKFHISVGGKLDTNIELPLYEPVLNQVDRIEVQTTTGKRWAKLSEVADITSLALRYQKDASSLAKLSMMATVVRNVVESAALGSVSTKSSGLNSLLSVVKQKRDEMVHPDMRSWSTLPSRLLAARFYVPKSVSRIKLVVYGKNNRVLSSQVIDIDKESHNFVYARTLDSTLYVAASKKMWMGLR